MGFLSSETLVLNLRPFNFPSSSFLMTSISEPYHMRGWQTENSDLTGQLHHPSKIRRSKYVEHKPAKAGCQMSPHFSSVWGHSIVASISTLLMFQSHSLEKRFARKGDHSMGIPSS
jgi:hypothetical protein